jgi:hypothetical protein
MAVVGYPKADASLFNIRLADQAGEMRRLLRRLVRNGVNVDHTMSVRCYDQGYTLRGVMTEDIDRVEKLLTHFNTQTLTYPYRRATLYQDDFNLRAVEIADFMQNTPLLSMVFSVPNNLNETEIGIAVEPLTVDQDNIDVINGDYSGWLSSLYNEYPFEYDKLIDEDDFPHVSEAWQRKLLKRYLILRLRRGVNSGKLFGLFNGQADIFFRAFVVGDCGDERQIQLVPHNRTGFDQALRILREASQTHPDYKSGKLKVEHGVLLKALVADKGQGVGEIQGLVSLVGEWNQSITAVVPMGQNGDQTIYFTNESVVP